MGLDIGFINFRTQEDLVHMRNHWAFANSFFEWDLPPVDPEYTDFLVDPVVILLVSAYWKIGREEVARAEAALSEETFEEICWSHEDAYDIALRRPVYRRIMMRLLQTAARSEPVLCYYSA
jgi:hypothetical protein